MTLFQQQNYPCVSMWLVWWIGTKNTRQSNATYLVCDICIFWWSIWTVDIPFLEYVLRARAAKPWGRLGGLQLPHFLTFARRRFVRIIGCSAASHASPWIVFLFRRLCLRAIKSDQAKKEITDVHTQLPITPSIMQQLPDGVGKGSWEYDPVAHLSYGDVTLDSRESWTVAQVNIKASKTVRKGPFLLDGPIMACVQWQL